MARLIDADSFLDEVKIEHDDLMQDPLIDKAMKWIEAVCFGRMVNILVKQPTVDAVEVVHGRWEMLGDDYANCTNCGNIFETRPTPMFFKANNKYCRKCGAKMDGDGNETV